VSARGFAVLRAAAAERLAAAVPSLATLHNHEAAQALVALLAFADVRIDAACQENAVGALVTTRPRIGGDAWATALIELVAGAVSAPLQGTHVGSACDVPGWLDEAGYLELETLLLHAGASVVELSGLADLAGAAIRTVVERAAALARAHFAAVTARDLGATPRTRNGLTATAAWALAPAEAGQATRPTVVLRRRQALDVYGGVASVLAEPALTAIIDSGKPLAPALAHRLGIGAGQLRRLRHVRDVTASLESHDDCVTAVVELVAHDTPLADWPCGSGWMSSPWRKAAPEHLLPPAYLADTQAKDAVAGLCQDILQPLAADRARTLGISGDLGTGRFLHGLTVPRSHGDAPVRRTFLAGLRAAILGCRGCRGASGFAEAVERWHRRAACVAAMRHERETDRPGWPGCCAAWLSPDGRFTVVPLTSASDLVAEGDALDHCVGGYYDQCRRGDTHILSLREDGARVATIELCLVTGEGGTQRLEVGQFKAHRNRRPAAQHHEALRLFVAALAAGTHPIAHAALAAHAKKMRASGDYAWRSGPLPLVHAERAWPLYRALLPRDAPDDLARWATESGLVPALDAILRALAAAPPRLPSQRNQR